RAPHKLQNPIAAPARQVPAAVHPAPRSTIPIRNKALRRQPATPDIPTPNPSPRDVKLPNNPNRHRPKTTIQDINPRVPDRTRMPTPHSASRSPPQTVASAEP